MAASIKISELNSLTDLTDVDLFLVSDMETGTSRKISYTNLKSNIIANTASVVADLIEVVTQNSDTSALSVDGVKERLRVLETDPVTKTYVDTRVSDVIGSAPDVLDSLSEIANAMGDNPNLIINIESRVTSLEVDPTTQANVDSVNQSLTTSIGTLSGSVTQNTTDITALQTSVTSLDNVQGDIVQNATDISALQTSVTSLNNVQGDIVQNATDISALQTTVSNLDIDIAPETLNSINELAGALGDDPQIITNLQSQLTEYIAHIEARNLEASLAEGYLYADTLFGG